MPAAKILGLRRALSVPRQQEGRQATAISFPIRGFSPPAKNEADRRFWWATHLGRAAIIVWCVIAVMSIGRAALYYFPRHAGCYWIYAEAGRAWLSGADLYSPRPDLDVYRYSPLVAVLLAPLGAVPNMLGTAVLRAVNLGVFFLGIYSWSKTAAPLNLSRQQRAAWLLLVAPLVARSLIDVQVNGLTIGLLLLGATALVQGRANWATACLVLACLLKAYVLSFALVLMLLYPRRLVFRFLAFAGLGLILPFAFQRPHYVLRQYELWVAWGLNSRPSSDFEDLWFLLVRMKIIASQELRWIEQLAAALAVAVFCLRQRLAGAPPKQLLALSLGLTCGWMMLLGPATEGCTYVLLAPAMAWIVLAAYAEESPRWQRALALAPFVIFTAGQFAFWFPWGGAMNRLGIFPLSAILTVAAILAAELRAPQPLPALAADELETIPFPGPVAERRRTAA